MAQKQPQKTSSTVELQQPLLPPVPRPESDAWATAWAAEFGHQAPAEIEARLAAVDAARAVIGLQPMNAEEKAALVPSADAAPSLKAELAAAVAKPVGPTPVTKAELDRIASERAAARLATQTRIRQELAPIFTRSAESAQAVKAAASDYRTLLEDFRNTKGRREQYLAALPQGEQSITLVTRLFEAIVGILTDFDTLPDRILAQGRVLEDAVQQIATAALSPQDRSTIVYERQQLEALCEQSGGFDQRIRSVMSLLKQIDGIAQDEGQRAVTASVMDERDLTVEQRQAVARQLAAGRK